VISIAAFPAVFKGRGHSIIGGETFAWEAGDVLALPSGTWYEQHAGISIDRSKVLFAMTDHPTLQALGLYRIEQAERAIRE
jgi:gentisate 1,2-dioxygenase